MQIQVIYIIINVYNNVQLDIMQMKMIFVDNVVKDVLNVQIHKIIHVQVVYQDIYHIKDNIVVKMINNIYIINNV